MWFREENCIHLLNTYLFIFKEFNSVYFLYVNGPVNYKNFISGLRKSKMTAVTLQFHFYPACLKHLANIELSIRSATDVATLILDPFG